VGVGEWRGGECKRCGCSYLCGARTLISHSNSEIRREVESSRKKCGQRQKQGACWRVPAFSLLTRVAMERRRSDWTICKDGRAEIITKVQRAPDQDIAIPNANSDDNACALR
jgi:hypothetical protein